MRVICPACRATLDAAPGPFQCGHCGTQAVAGGFAAIHVQEPGERPVVVLIGSLLAMASGAFIAAWGLYFLLIGHAVAQEGFFGALIGGFLVVLAVLALVVGALKLIGGGLAAHGNPTGRTLALIGAILGLVTGGPAIVNLLGLVVIAVDIVAFVLLFQSSANAWLQAHADRRRLGLTG